MTVVYLLGVNQCWRLHDYFAWCWDFWPPEDTFLPILDKTGNWPAFQDISAAKPHKRQSRGGSSLRFPLVVYKS